ncbi:hypothetical protein LCGC14_2710590 [marine sediment metagenome]|uniref:Uncharacterized protein n=1 Tax=marine sediment metagenome TaxID=412755 RepID=A0A0F9BM15_9ZZZZ
MSATNPNRPRPIRMLDENGVLLLTDGDWSLELYDDDNGPVIYHTPCKLWTAALNRKYPQCSSCGESIPCSMITPFTLMNWEHAHDPEYFVPFMHEDDDHAAHGGT